METTTWPPRNDTPLDPHVRAFLDDIAENPRGAGVRLVFADWLAERDDPRAELLRLQAESIRNEHPDGLRNDLDDDIERRAQAGVATSGPAWLGELPQQNGSYSLCLEDDLLEVMGHAASQLIHGAGLAGLRRRLQEGWI